MLRLLFMLIFIGCVQGECQGEDLSLAPKPYTKPENLSVCEKPYRGPNCACPAPMFECACHKFGVCGDKPGCIEMKKVNNWGNDCGDYSDEFGDYCPSGFQCHCFNTTCNGVVGCVHYPCNGLVDCPDGSDEVNCSCPADEFECDCLKTNNCSGQGKCLGDFWLCNGRNDCSDWSDEVNCSCSAETFECACYKTSNCTVENACQDTQIVCNGQNDCGDWSDEINCNCPPHTFECPCYKSKNCTSSVGCIRMDEQCNGQNNCGDWSDEINCTCPANYFECSCFKTNNCTTRNGCINKNERCNGKNNCGDWSDEVNCTCPVHQFQCSCVSSKQCNISSEGSCIDRSEICNGNRDCFDDSDETHYACNCSGVYARCPCDPGRKHCPSTGRCIPFKWLGDNITDCSDKSDELCLFSNFTCESCTMFATTCESEQLAKYLVHSAVPAKCSAVIQPFCVDSNRCKAEKAICVSTTCETAPNFCWDLFLCENRQIVTIDDFCNSVSNCSDNSDEIKRGIGFKCSGSSRQGVCVLPQANIYDSFAQCSDKSDICFINGQFRCFQCLDKKLIISPKQVCDGIVDCFDMSDECLCPDQSLCDEIKSACQFNHTAGANSTFCSDHKKYYFYEKNSEQPRCLTDNANCHKVSRTGRCTGIVRDGMWLRGEVGCPNMFDCFAKQEINIHLNQVCDGKVDCDDGSDEFTERCHSSRFYCKNKAKISIDRKTVCDGIIDCDNESDEEKCSCEKVRFYCTNKQPLSVEWKLVQNGIQDCSDGSDECVNLAWDAFADVNEMIANPVYKAIFWITSVLAMVGNTFVFVATAHSLWKADRKQNVFINTSVFILNLSLSDFLMGVYLFAIILQATQFSGSYCLHDKEWRSSRFCSGLGALAIVSSEASAFTMTAMTTFRLVSAFKPFIIRSVGVSKIVVAELICWITSIALATIPLLESTSGYFTTDVWFPNNIFGTDFVSRESMTLLAKRIAKVKPQNWFSVKQTISEAFSLNPPKGEFGYYGETSVCMPRLFATTSEFAWEYSTLLITTNFLMFIYMVIAYVLIYKQSNRMKGSRITDVSSKMQKRISRLIVTDFCCWIPVCVMGYLSVGGIKMPPDAYVLSACLLLPINSALNPLLYSKAIEDHFIKVKKWVAGKCASLQAFAGRSSELAVRYNPDAEDSD